MSTRLEQVKAAPIKTYKIEIVCRNCGQQPSISIPFGTLVAEHKHQVVCTYCGCSEQQLEDYLDQLAENKYGNHR